MSRAGMDDYLTKPYSQMQLAIWYSNGCPRRLRNQPHQFLYRPRPIQPQYLTRPHQQP